jgi:hypothetical protein
MGRELLISKGFVAHAAFENPLAKAEAPPRKSLEVQIIVVNKEVQD